MHLHSCSKAHGHCDRTLPNTAHIGWLGCHHWDCMSLTMLLYKMKWLIQIMYMFNLNVIEKEQIQTNLSNSYTFSQWRNSQGVECLPDTCHREISDNLPGKEREGKTGKWRRKEGKSRKGRLKIENGRRKSYKMRRGLFFFLAFHFSKPLKFVLGLPKWEFSTGEKHFLPGKKHFTPVKNPGKITLPPLKNIPLTPRILQVQNTGMKVSGRTWYMPGGGGLALNFKIFLVGMCRIGFQKQGLQKGLFLKTRRFSNHESRLRIHQSMWIQWPFLQKLEPKVIDP